MLEKSPSKPLICVRHWHKLWQHDCSKSNAFSTSPAAAFQALQPQMLSSLNATMPAAKLARCRWGTAAAGAHSHPAASLQSALCCYRDSGGISPNITRTSAVSWPTATSDNRTQDVDGHAVPKSTAHISVNFSVATRGRTGLALCKGPVYTPSNVTCPRPGWLCVRAQFTPRITSLADWSLRCDDHSACARQQSTD